MQCAKNNFSHIQKCVTYHFIKYQETYIKGRIREFLEFSSGYFGQQKFCMGFFGVQDLIESHMHLLYSSSTSPREALFDQNILTHVTTPGALSNLKLLIWFIHNRSLTLDHGDQHHHHDIIINIF